MANVKITDLTAYTDAASTDVLPIVDVSNNVTKKISISDILKATPAGTAALPAIAIDGDPNTGIWSPAADTLAVSAGGTERIRISSAGYIGIGVNSPTSKLQVLGSAGSGIFCFQAGNSASNYGSFLDAGGTMIGICGGGGGGAISAGASTDFALRAEGNLLLASGGNTERMRISSAGILSVGTASAPNGSHTFKWTGGNRCIFANSDPTAANVYGIGILYDGGATPNGTGNEFLYCADNTTARATIRSNGGIANYSANDVNLSDRNVKKDIALASSTWNCLKGWEIVSFRYKEQPDDADLNLGVIAQQVAENCPEVVTVFQEAKEATDDQPAQEEQIGVKEQQMMWMAIKALQEAQLRIETLEAEVAALKGL